MVGDLSIAFVPLIGDWSVASASLPSAGPLAHRLADSLTCRLADLLTR